MFRNTIKPPNAQTLLRKSYQIALQRVRWRFAPNTSHQCEKTLDSSIMTMPIQPNIKLTNSPNYRDNYANSVQIRASVWDLFLVFGTLQQQTETQVEVTNFQGIYLSPQQAKALLNVLQQNIINYEKTFGEIKLDARMAPTGQVH